MDSPLQDARVFGLQPWFPWPLSRWRWLNEPVAAERLAAVRLCVALIMLLDVILSFSPRANDFFGQGSLIDSPTNYSRVSDGRRWSLFENVFAEPITDPGNVRALMTLWGMASFLLFIGLFTRLAALFCFALSVSVGVTNTYIDNAGDTVRTLILFYLMLSPCAAAWSVESWLRRRFHWTAVRAEGGEFRGVALVRRDQPTTQPHLVHPWSLRLLFVQMMVVYLFNGLYKALGSTWHNGASLHHVLCDLTLARWSYATLPIPGWITTTLTRFVLWWELLFVPIMLVPWHWLADLWKTLPHVGPAHVLFRWTRELVLVFGALFHLGIFISMEIGGFALYMLCLYPPLLPLERTRWGSQREIRPVNGDQSESSTPSGTGVWAAP